MKKFFTALLIVFMLFNSAACTKRGNEKATESETKTVEEINIAENTAKKDIDDNDNNPNGDKDITETLQEEDPLEESDADDEPAQNEISEPDPKETVKPTPGATVSPIDKNRPTPAPTKKPSPSAKPDITPKPTTTPQPTAKPQPTIKPEPTVTPEPTVKPTAMPKPTAKPQPTVRPKPTPKPSPIPTPKPVPTTKPTPEPVPTTKPTPKPTAAPEVKAPQHTSALFNRSKLSGVERDLYDILYNASLELKTRVDISHLNLTRDRVSKVCTYFTYDCTDHFWLNSCYPASFYSSNNVVIDVAFGYTMSKSERDNFQKQIDSKVDKILSGVNKNWSTYQKVKYIHDYLVLNTEYDFNAPCDQDIRSVLLYNKSVCAGYSKTFQYLLKQLDIQAITVSGIANDGSHAWNIVNIDGKYYNFDVTWDDPYFGGSGGFGMDMSSYITYEYFGVTDDYISKSHKRNPYPTDEHRITLPKCTATDANYYVKEGLLFSSFNSDAVNKISKALLKEIDKKPRFFSFRFSGRSGYDTFINSVYSYWKQVVDEVNSKAGNIIKYDKIMYFYGDNYTVTMVIDYK